MRVEFGQAVFGDSGAGQTALLARSGPYDPQLYTAADLPEPLPVGFTPPPYYTIRRFGDLLAFMKTAIDHEQRRAGMVRTHVLTAHIQTIADIDDLRPILEALDPFTNLDDVRSGLRTVEVGAAPARPEVPGAAALLSAVSRRFGRAGAPVVWVGLDSFVDALCETWRVLPGAARRSLSVRLAMQAQNVYDSDRQGDTTRILTVPERMSGSWGREGIIGPTVVAPPPGPFLTLITTGDGPLGRLLDSLGLDLNDTDAYGLLDQAAELYARLEGEGKALDLDELLQLGELGGRVAMSLAPESAFRTVVGGALVLAAEQDGGDRVRNLRNFKAGAYIDGKRVLATAAGAWAVRALLDSPRPGDAEVAGLAFTSQNSEWNRAVKHAMRTGLDNPLSAGVAVGWFGERDDLLATVGGLVPMAAPAEDAYAEALIAKVLDDATADAAGLAEKLAEWARTRGWAIVYGEGIRLARGADDALLLVAKARGRVDAAVQRLAPHASGAALVHAAVETNHPALIETAAARCAAEPNLLADLDVSSDAARRLWLGAIDRRGKVADVDMVILGEALHESGARPPLPPDVLGEFVDRVGITLLDDERLAGALDRLPGPARDRLLVRTADAWVRRFRAWAAGGGPEPDRPDTHTAQAVARHHRTREVLPVSSGLDAVVWLFEAVSGYGESEFVQALRAAFPANRDPDLASALLLGRFVQKRKWKSAAAGLRERAGYYPGYGPAYAETESLFGWLERMMSFSLVTRGIEQLDRDGWWQAFQELCERTYPEGVKQRAVIEESGGKLSEMKLEDKTGRDQWRHVARELQKGAFDFNAGDLLRTMSTQLPKNTEVRKMLDLYTEHIA